MHKEIAFDHNAIDSTVPLTIACQAPLFFQVVWLVYRYLILADLVASGKIICSMAHNFTWTRSRTIEYFLQICHYGITIDWLQDSWYTPFLLDMAARRLRSAWNGRDLKCFFKEHKSFFGKKANLASIPTTSYLSVLHSSHDESGYWPLQNWQEVE